MGELYDFFCSGHEPHKCEILFDLASIDVGGEAKCNVCSNPGTSTRSVTDACHDKGGGGSFHA